ncbi:AAA family ATPase [Rhizobium leguminosarum]|nr:AAA family ATPase [Rhizobium leguminosarum]TAV94194.1 AAA family ATPase [Rhizobium leguminosarum]TAW35269.1 AAA family ATPase [Rhizobium leguminosarum]
MRRGHRHTSSALARIVCTLALRDTLASHKKVHSNNSFSIAVRVPNELLNDYIGAAGDLMKILPGVKEIEACAATRGHRGIIDYNDVTSTLRLADRVLAIFDQASSIPRALLAAVDDVIDTAPIDAATIARAVRLLDDRVFPVADIEKMLVYPIAEVLDAIRPGRDVEEALERLRDAHRGTDTTGDPPPVEELHGYGAAAGWARDLSEDLGGWRRGRIPWSEIDAGLLLSGPPGVGKTMFAKSVAKSAGVSFVASSLAQWQSRGHLGDLLGAMRATFAEAAAKSPCILLLDEFDSIGDRTRFDDRNAQYCTEVVAGLLECLDGVDRREGIVVIGACNHPDLIDAALLRPGRLGTHIRVGLPDAAARAAILRSYLPDHVTARQLDEAARECDGVTSADLAHAAKGARRLARRRGEEPSIDDLRANLPPVTPIEGELRERIAIHEAGHAAVGLALDVGALTGVVVRKGFSQNAGIGGGTVFEPNKRLPSSTYFLDQIAMNLGGMAAEIVIYGEHLEGSGGGAGSDLHNAADLATIMVAQIGMGGTLNHFRANTPEEREKIRRSLPAVNRQVEQTLATQLERAKAIVRANLAFLRELAAVLDREGGVDGDKARALFYKKGVSDAA